jgi:Rrf2 family protein
MKFNTKTRYGLRTMLELALNESSGKGVYQKDISASQGVSVKYLDHIIASLKAAGLVKNTAGKKSGYKLGRSAGEITIYDIYRAFEDDLAIIGCLTEGGHCPRKQHCTLQDYWCGLNRTIRSSMEAMTLMKLAENQKQQESTQINLSSINQ